MVQFNDDHRHRYLGPHVAAFTRAMIPDLSDQHAKSVHWVDHYYLSPLRRVTYSDPMMHAFVYQFLKRVSFALEMYKLARSATLAFLSSDKQFPQRYVFALSLWESILGQAWHAIELLMSASKKRRVFEGGDGSVEERLNALYNDMKHANKRIESGLLPDGSTLPVWLTNQGLQSQNRELAFQEIAEVLVELSKWADALADPKTAKSKIEAI